MRKLRLAWSLLVMWIDMKILILLGVIINRRINAYLPDLDVKVTDMVRWNINIAGVGIGFSAKIPQSYSEMGSILISVGEGMRGIPTEKNREPR